MLLEGSCDIIQNDHRYGEPYKIEGKKNGCDKEIKYDADHDSSGTENDAEYPSDDAIVPIERLEEITDGDFERHGPINILERFYEFMCDCPRTVNIPMVKRI